MTILVCWEVHIQSQTDAGTMAGDCTVNVQVLNAETLENIRNGIRQTVVQNYRGAAVTIGRVVFRSVTPLDDSVIVKPRG